MALIKCENAALGYEGKPYVTGLNFEISEGEYLCIVGENGSGKSTLIKGLLGLKKPLSGSIVFGDGLKQKEIGYLPQQTVVQKDFPASVYEVVLSGRLNRRGLRPFYSAVDRETAVRNMKRLEIYDLAHKCYRELSGGQQQRVLLARALCATGKLLLLDEPASGLDPIVTNELYKIIDELNEKDGITVIMVSHDICAVSNSASHVLHLKHCPLFFGSREDYFNSELGKSFIGGAHHDYH